jgi:hypothetical protein
MMGKKFELNKSRQTHWEDQIKKTRIDKQGK